jgi:hypothetical protein
VHDILAAISPQILKRPNVSSGLAAAHGARLAALPEVFNWRDKRSEEPAAEALDDRTSTANIGIMLARLPDADGAPVPPATVAYRTSRA